MGEVWRARDTRLGRDVAIKVLPEAYAANRELRARIEREAKSISGLNHPHICTLYDVGRDGELEYLVLELVEGETLAARIARGSLPTNEVLRLGMQIAEALECAHRAGIVHRDLKPANVMITKGGAKLLDFGLARGSAVVESSERETISPTLAEPLTKDGHIVGTFQYMAPEQLEGAEPDPRSDLWALGCVLYEMTTGKPPFAGNSPASLISSILKDEPRAMAELAPLSPPALDRVVRQCLAKDREERWQTAGDLRRELAWISSSGPQVSAGSAAIPPVGTLATLRAWAWPLVAAGAIALAILGWAMQRSQPTEAMRVSIVHNGDGSLGRDPAYLSFSPDGERIAYVAAESTGMTLWIRQLSESAPRLLLRARGAIWFPTWSPDGRSLAYCTPGEGGKLWRIPAAGGTPQQLAPVLSPRGVAWSSSGVILYAPDPVGPLWRIGESGGTPSVATALDTSRGQTSHRAPHFLPDGDHFIYSGLPGTDRGIEVFAGSLRSGTSEFIATLPQTGAIYADPGYLLYSREGKIVAHRFDARRRKLSGEPVVITEETAFTAMMGKANVTASRNGRIAWRPSEVSRSQIEWVDREGRSLGTVETIDGDVQDLEVARDGRRAIGARQLASNDFEVIYYDPDRGSFQRVSPAGMQSESPVWAPDGVSFYMKGWRGQGRQELFHRSLAGGGSPEPIVVTDQAFSQPEGVTADGRFLVFSALNRETDWDVYKVELDGGRLPTVVVANPGQESSALSPDGRWVAVRATSPGKRELLVLPLDGSRTPRRVAARVDTKAEWGPGARELYFDVVENEERLIFVVPIDPASGASTGPPRLLFKRSDVSGWAPAPDGQRFLLSIRQRALLATEIRVDIDWPSLMRKH